MTNRTADLLGDLAKLLRKYGPEEFERLARSLRSEEFVSLLASILESSAAAGRKASSRTTSPKIVSGIDALARTLERLRTDAPDRYQMVVEARRRLLEDRLLPRLTDLEQFALREGLGELHGKKREQAVTAVLERLATLDADRLRHALSGIAGAAEPRSGLQGWSDIILPKSRKPAR